MIWLASTATPLTIEPGGLASGRAGEIGIPLDVRRRNFAGSIMVKMCPCTSPIIFDTEERVQVFMEVSHVQMEALVGGECTVPRSWSLVTGNPAVILTMGGMVNSCGAPRMVCK